MKDIKGYEGEYAITEDGKVWSHKRQKFLKQSLIGNTHYKNNLYRGVVLTQNGVQKCFRVHRLVAQAFIPNPCNLPEVNHKNLIKTDNRVENLEWVSRSENVRHFINSGTASFIKEEGEVYQNRQGWWCIKENGKVRRFTVAECEDRGLEFMHDIKPDEERKRSEGDVWKRCNGWFTKENGEIKRIIYRDYYKYNISNSKVKYKDGDVWKNKSGWFTKEDGVIKRLGLKDYDKYGIRLNRKHHRKVGDVWKNKKGVWYTKTEDGIERIKICDYSKYKEISND